MKPARFFQVRVRFMVCNKFYREQYICKTCYSKTSMAIFLIKMIWIIFLRYQICTK